MKKFGKSVLAVLLFVFCLALVAGCDSPILGIVPGTGEETPSVTEKTALEAVAEKYEKVSEAKNIGRTVEVYSGKLLQYSSEKTYQKTDGGFAVTGTVKRLNDLSADTAYTETKISETVGAGTFEGGLKLSAMYLTDATVKEGKLEARVADGDVERVFGTEALPSAVHGLKLTVETNEDHVTSIGIEYASGSSSVTISLTFAY